MFVSGVFDMKWRQMLAGLAIASAALGLGSELPVLAGEQGSHEHRHAEDANTQMEPSGPDGITEATMGHEGQTHAHPTLEVFTYLPQPSVQLIAHPDAKSGWNLELQLKNFEFAPADVNESSSQNEGHAHLYVNGKKVTRLYGNWYYLEDLEPGDNEIRVTLNTNLHHDLAVDGEVISASTTISVTE